MARFERPAGAFTPTIPTLNTTKYQDDSAAKVAISSAKVDGDINKAFQSLNELAAESLPSMLGNAGKWLFTNGASAIWTTLGSLAAKNTVATADIDNKALTVAKVADGTANSVLGWNTSGVATSLLVGNGLGSDGTALSAATASQAQAIAGTATNVVMTPLSAAQRDQAVRQSFSTEYIIANGSTSLLMPLDASFDEFEVVFENVTQSGSNTFRLYYHDGSANITTTSSQFLAAQGGGSGANGSTGQIFQLTLAPAGIHLLKGTVFNRSGAQKATFFNGGLQEGTGLDATIMSSITPSGPKYANLNLVLSGGTFTGGRVYVRKISR